jgi:hypothetical protein
VQGKAAKMQAEYEAQQDAALHKKKRDRHETAAGASRSAETASVCACMCDCGVECAR